MIKVELYSRDRKGKRKALVTKMFYTNFEKANAAVFALKRLSKMDDSIMVPVDRECYKEGITSKKVVNPYVGLIVSEPKFVYSIKN